MLAPAPAPARSLRTVAEWEAHLGAQVRDLRQRQGRTQADLARDAGVSVSAIHAVEHGTGSSLSTVVSVVRALDRTSWLDELAPPVAVSPMAKLREAHGLGRPSHRGDRPAPR